MNDSNGKGSGANERHRTFPIPGAPSSPETRSVGYTKYADYKDWLRDEFDFRCVYCMRKEVCERRRAIWVVEHLIPRKLRKDLTTDYANLVLACTTCNSFESADHMPDPCKFAYGQLVSVSADGRISHNSREGLRLIRVARLDDAEATEWRRKEIVNLKNLKIHAPEEYRKKMGFPTDLPDLANRKVKNNSRPQEAKQCRSEQNKQGTLPSTY